jgi:hypothetical protein
MFSSSFSSKYLHFIVIFSFTYGLITLFSNIWISSESFFVDDCLQFSYGYKHNLCDSLFTFIELFHGSKLWLLGNVWLKM